MPIADIFVIGFVVVSAIIAFMVGCVRVLLGLGAWLGAALATLYGFEHAQPYFKEWIESPLFADIAAGLSVFVVSLIILTVVSHAVAGVVKRSGFKALDRSLGLVSGLVLGAGALCALFLVVEQVLDLPRDHDQRPEWVRTARTVPVVEWGANKLWSIVPSRWQNVRVSEPSLPDLSPDPEETFRKLIVPRTKQTAPKEKPGYNTRERRDMDRLIESRQ